MRWSTVVPTQHNKLLVALAALITAVAAVDTLVTGKWDLVIVLGFALLVQLVLLISLRAPRPAVPLRGDLYRWLDERSAATGEPLERIADRCVAAYRAGLTADHHGDGGDT